MKRFLLFSVCVGLTIALAGCGTAEPAQDSSPASPESSLPSEAQSSQEALESSSEPESSSDEQTSQENEAHTSDETGQEPETVLEETEMKLNVEVNGTIFTATLEDNAAVDAFLEMMREAPVVIVMNDYSGFEKVGPLGTSLPASNSQTTTQAGDIVLYNSNQIVIFYGSNSWSYTRLGKIDDLTGWEEALGSGDVTVTFSIGG